MQDSPRQRAATGLRSGLSLKAPSASRRPDIPSWPSYPESCSDEISLGHSPPDFDRSSPSPCFHSPLSAIMGFKIECDCTQHPIRDMKRRAQMQRFQRFFYGLNPYLLSSIAGALTVAQIVLAFLVRGPRSEALEWVGWICLWTSGIFGWLPVIALRRKGGVAQGQSYMRTTALVDSGIYAVVRHPQSGTAWLLINLGVTLIAQHWSSLVLGLTSMVLAYADTFKLDHGCIGKFGDPYRQYVRRVPRVNFLLGLIRLAWQKASAK
jgi:protein-S-isoprenylcysteine O-methyltransferase Ste14